MAFGNGTALSAWELLQRGSRKGRRRIPGFWAGGGAMLRVLVKLQENHCRWCGEKFGRKGSQTEPSLDHLIPKSEGGTNAQQNLVAACKRCNNARGSLDVETWLCVKDDPVALAKAKEGHRVAVAAQKEQSKMPDFSRPNWDEPEEARRPASGFFASLTPDQQQAALDCRGDDHHGDPQFPKQRKDG